RDASDDAAGRIVAAPEFASGRLADDHHRRRRRAVGVGEIAATQQGHAHRLKKSRTDDAPVDRYGSTGGKNRFPGRRYRSGRVIAGAERNSARYASRANTRNAAKRLDQLSIERLRLSVGRILRGRRRQLKRENPLRLEPEADPLELDEA